MSRGRRGHTAGMRVFVDGTRALRFDDGTPVTAASGVGPLGDGWLVVQDDGTFAAWCRPDTVHRLRVLPPVDGLDVFRQSEGTKHLKPDLEVACPAEVNGEAAALLLGSGSSPRRMRGVVVRLEEGEPVVRSAELTALYARVAERLGLPMDAVNLEGGSLSEGVVRWFNRGNLQAGIRSASVDVPLDALVAAVLGRGEPSAVPVDGPQEYDLGQVEGVGLAVTDAVALPDGRVLLSAAAEDTPNAVDDGPVVATALALVEGDTVRAVAPIPEIGGHVHKVEGLALQDVGDGVVLLLAVVDDDDPAAPSAVLDLRVELD